MSDEMSEEDRKRLFSGLGKIFMDAMTGKFDPKKGGVRIKRIDDNGSAELEYMPPLPKDPD
jgi:hypothetical protein